MAQSSKTALDALREWPPHSRRLWSWHQTPDRRVDSVEQCGPFIDEVGIATLFETSPEVANCFHAHMGDPAAKTENKWDSPSGRVYGWRWGLGRQRVAFYAAIVRKRPTFVSWPLLPPVLRLIGDLRTHDELYDFGVISNNAYRIAKVLDASSEPVGTGQLRSEAGFPTGREHSSAYHKALEELDSRLLITNEFPASDPDGNKHHLLLCNRHRDSAESAGKMTEQEAAAKLLEAYLTAAVYVVPVVLERHMRIKKGILQHACQEMMAAGELRALAVPGAKFEAFTRPETR